MNFFERQALVRRQSRLLMLLFVVALAGIIAAIGLLFAVIFKAPLTHSIITSTILVLTVVGCATYYRMSSLSSGGAAIANQLGAMPMPEHINDYQLQRLRNVIEEIAIASGVQVPQIFIMNDEAGINAFASGYSTSDAAITVTRGAMNRLNRDELQAVIGHEFSHILNGDMRLNIQLVGLLFGIMLIGMTGQKILIHGRFRGKGAANIYLIALGLMVIGFIGWFCGRLIKAGINRQREYLADACAVQYTRQDIGLTGALKKIGGLQEGSSMANPHAEEFSHMFFSQGTTTFMNLLASHPPLIERIKAIDPHFSDAELSELRARWSKAEPDGAEEDRALGFADNITDKPAAAKNLAAAPLAIIQQIGSSHASNYQRAHAIINSIPDNLRQAARNYYGVVPLMYALLYSADAKIQEQQNLELSKHQNNNTTIAAAKAFYLQTSQLDARLRLPLAAICFAALRQHPRDELKSFMDTIQAIIHADNAVNVHEYCLGHLVTKHIGDFLNPNQTGMPGNKPLQSAAAEVSKLMAVFAEVGQSDTAAAEAAYLDGMSHALPGVAINYQPTSSFADTLDAVWPVLDSLDPKSKQLLIEGLVTAINHDNVVTIEEAELLHTVCALLHCPLPMLLHADT